MIKKKVCLLGAFGVGKTSLVAKFVHSIFDERYHSTIGVKIDKKTVWVGGEEVMMMIWDIAGEEEFFQIPESYIRGSSGCLFVADGTRPETLVTLKGIRERVFRLAGGALPNVTMLIKPDLTDDWRVGGSDRRELEADGTRCILTSAKRGDGVEEGFGELAAKMVGRG